MSRAVFVSAGGDPFILLFVHKLFREKWYDEIDKFYVCYNNNAKVPLEASIEAMDRLMEDPKVRIIYHPEGIGNGRPITEMALVSREDYVMLLEDDGFIFTSDIVDKCFKQIESGQIDALGSPRFSCGTEIGEALKLKYNLDYSGYGDVGPNFWPNFFFCKREDLLKTDQNFASKHFQKGSYYPELDHTMGEDEYADTFGWATIQMRHKGVRFGALPQFHASPYEITDKEKKEGNWIGEDPFWLHGGSLSTSWNGYLNGTLPPLDHESAILEIETRVAFWTICSDFVDGFDEFKREYRAGIGQLIVQGKLDLDRINQKIAIYKMLTKSI